MSYRAFQQIIEDLYGLAKEHDLPFLLRQTNDTSLMFLPQGTAQYSHYSGRRLGLRKTVDARGGWGPTSVEILAHDPQANRTVLLTSAYGFITRKTAATRFIISGPDESRAYARKIIQVMSLCGATWIHGAERSGVGGICDQCSHQLMCLTREE